MTVIEIKLHRCGWKPFEAPGIEPVFPTEDDAISYAQVRVRFRTGEIRVLDSIGNVERSIAFDESKSGTVTSALFRNNGIMPEAPIHRGADRYLHGVSRRIISSSQSGGKKTGRNSVDRGGQISQYRAAQVVRRLPKSYT